MRKLRTVVCAAVFVLFTITELRAIGPVASPLTNWLPFAMSGFFSVRKDDVTKDKVKPTKPDHPGRQNSRPNSPIGRPIDPLALLSEYVPSPGEWRLVPGTAFADYRLSDRDAARLGIMGDQGSTAVLDEKTGSAYDPDGHKWYFWGGGGTSYGGNEVYQLDLETLEIAMITPPSVLDDAIFDADGVASANHGGK